MKKKPLSISGYVQGQNTIITRPQVKTEIASWIAKYLETDLVSNKGKIIIKGRFSFAKIFMAFRSRRYEFGDV